MILLIIGLDLWIGAHLFKRILPDLRARMGDKGKGLMALIMVAGIVLMVIGYRGMGEIPVWSPPSWAVHVNNLAMLIAIFLLGLGSSKSRLRGALRHPMLTGVLVWAAAHLLVNGDQASIVLFGGVALWTLLQMVLVNRAEPDWTRPAPGNAAGDIKLAVISVVVFAVIAGVHYWLGKPVFAG